MGVGLVFTNEFRHHDVMDGACPEVSSSQVVALVIARNGQSNLTLKTHQIHQGLRQPL